MTDHLAEARRITEGQTAYDSTALSCGILHALIAIAERMGEGRASRCPATRTNAAGQRFGCSQLADHEGRPTRRSHGSNGTGASTPGRVIRFRVRGRIPSRNGRARLANPEGFRGLHITARWP